MSPSSSSCVFASYTDVFEKALSAGFIQATDYVEIWQAYLDYLRRRVDFSRGGNSRVCVWNRIVCLNNSIHPLTVFLQSQARSWRSYEEHSLDL